MKKILLGTMLLSTLFFGAEIKKDTVASDNLVVEFYGLSIERTYKCEPKESKWFQFNTKKDDEIEKYCKNSLDNYTSVDSGMFYNDGYNRYIKKSFNNVSLINKFNINEIFKDVKVAEAITSKVYLDVYYLDKINEKKSAKYEIYLITPNNEKVNISKGNINEEEFVLDIPKTLVLNKYTNTYDIDNLRECIDGKIWIKKYGKMSGDECFWKIENKSQQNMQ
ncbi:hypothetical protein [Aliarcobacter butzleri]|uniref:hypothetical protein n=1 Tax=Aliarcobacter butzleri TaxID=28197 RepID=UPI00126A1D97|nr:hypothetical protein [Aliarcobacter butzleri]